MAGRRSVSLILAIAAAAAGGDPGPRTERPLDPARVPWKRLEFEAKKLFFTGRTEIRLAPAAASELGQQLIASPRGAALEPRGPAARLELEAAFAGRRSRTAVWFDPRQGAAMQRRKLRIGKKGYQKTYRFTADGVYSYRRAPLDANQAAGPIDGWGKIEEAFYPYPQRRRECGPISEPEILLYMVSAAEGEGRFFTCSFSDKTLHRVELVPRGTVPLRVDYATVSPAQRSRRQGRIEAEHLTLEARPLATDGDRAFEFLGLEGDVDIYVDGRVPVEVAGRLPGLGRVRIKLILAELK